VSEASNSRSCEEPHALLLCQGRHRVRQCPPRSAAPSFMLNTIISVLFGSLWRKLNIQTIRASPTRAWRHCEPGHWPKVSRAHGAFPQSPAETETIDLNRGVPQESGSLGADSWSRWTFTSPTTQHGCRQKKDGPAGISHSALASKASRTRSRPGRRLLATRFFSLAYVAVPVILQWTL
jgi:hypothetical protein